MKVRSILVVDDNFDFRHSLVEFLRLEGFEVREAVNGDEALHIFEGEAFDLVLTDIMMPEKTGFEIISEMLSRKPDQWIIAMTGGTKWVSKYYLEAASDLGSIDILAKPFPIQNLLDKIEELGN